MVDPLTRLAVAFGTDKFGYHDYTPNYFALFEHLRDRPVRLLEIGVGGYRDADRGGESLQMWRDFFPRGRITGIDIQQKDMDLGERVRILQGSQVDADFLNDLVRDHGPFDIIIDDGSHRNEHVIESFEILFPTLAPGGIYVAEDLQTAFFPRFGGSLEMTAPNSVAYFAELFAGDMGARDIAAIERFHNMVALHKAGPGRAPRAPCSLPAENARVLALAGADLPGWLEGGAKVAKGARTLKGLKKQLADDGPFDLVIDAGGKTGAKRLAAALPLLEDGARYLLQGTPERTLRALFIAVDHREIAVFFPEAEPHPLAKRTLAIARDAEGVLIHKGANDYPSNFDFDFGHPLALANFDVMERILLEQGRESGLLLFADIMTRAGDEGRARKMLEKLDESGAGSRSYFNVAVRRRKLDGDWQGALSLLKQAVQRYPGDYRIRSQLGGVLAREREWDQAVAEFRRGIDLAPRDPLLHIQLANALGQLGEDAAAVEAARTAVELAPDHAGHHEQLGRLLANAGRFDQAVTVLRRALELNGESPNAYRQLSRALFELERTKEAIEALENALRLRPDNPEYKRWQERLNIA